MQLFGHLEESVGQRCHLARAMMVERPDRCAITGGDAFRALHQRIDRLADGAQEDQADEQRAAEDGDRRQHHLAALAIKMLDDVVRRPRQIDHAGDLAVDGDWHGDEDADPRSAADRIERW